MTLADFFALSYAWADQNASFILAAALLIPLVGTALAWIGKGGRTDADGKFIASAVMGLALVGVLVELAAIFVARSILGTSLLSANLLLLLAPVVCLAGSVLGIRMVFPLSQLGSVKTATDLGLFLLACGAALWLMSKFRGWGVLFMGSFMQLVVIGLLGLFVLWRLYRRAFGITGTRPAQQVDAGQPQAALLPAAGPGSSLVAGSLAVGVVAVAAGALIGLWQLTRPASGGAGQGQTPPTVVTIPAANPAPTPVSPPTAADPGSPTGRAPSAYGYLDDDGAQHYVQRLDQVPPKYRASAKPVD